MYVLIYFIITAIICGGFSGFVASQKNRDVLSWVLLGLVFEIFALIAIVGLPIQKLKKDTRICDQCRSDIPLDARICPYCITKFSKKDIIASIKHFLKKEPSFDMVYSASKALIELSTIDTIPVLLSLLEYYNVEKMIKNHLISLGQPAITVLERVKNDQEKYIQIQIDKIVSKISKT